MRRLSYRQARWQTELADFNFRLVNKKGTSMQKADVLSCNPTHKPDGFDNEDVILIKEEWMG